MPSPPPPPPILFRNYGGIHQFRVLDEKDLAFIDALDPARWAATSAPLRDLQCDPAFPAALDPDGTGRIRVSQLVAGRDFLFERLARREGLRARRDAIDLDDLDATKEAGQALRAAAAFVIREQKLDGTRVALADVRAFRAAIGGQLGNGDGVVPADVVPEAEAAQLVADIVATTGGGKDAGGKDGVGQAELDRFVERAKAWLDWRARGAGVLVWGDATEAAAALVASLDAKIEAFFLRCDLLKAEGAEHLRLREDDLRALAAKDESAIGKHLDDAPIQTPNAAGVLALAPPVPTAQALGGAPITNPRHREALDELRQKVLAKALGPSVHELTRASWRRARAIFDPFFAWQKDKPAEPFDTLGEDRVKALLAGPLPGRVAHFIAVDKEPAERLARVAELEKLLVMQRWFLDLANNFVNFSSVYVQAETAIVEAGSLVIDGRRLDFCMKVADRGAHRPLAAESLICLVYAAITDKEGAAPAFEIVAPVTAGDRGRLRTGKRGLFIDLAGREWDAQITELVEQPVSVVEAMFAPFRKAWRFVSKKVGDWIGSASDERQKALMEQAEKGADAAKAKADETAKHIGEKLPAPPAGPPPKPPLDANSLVLGAGIAFAGLSSIAAAIFGLITTAVGLLAILGVVAFVLALSALVGWLRLRRRDMGLLFEAGGWAMNIEMKVNRRVGRVFTFTPPLPPNARLEHADLLATPEDRAAARRRLVVLVVLVVAAFAGLLGYLDAHAPIPPSWGP